MISSGIRPSEPADIEREQSFSGMSVLLADHYSDHLTLERPESQEAAVVPAPSPVPARAMTVLETVMRAIKRIPGRIALLYMIGVVVVWLLSTVQVLTAGLFAFVLFATEPASAAPPDAGVRDASAIIDDSNSDRPMSGRPTTVAEAVLTLKNAAQSRPTTPAERTTRNVWIATALTLVTRSILKRLEAFAALDRDRKTFLPWVCVFLGGVAGITAYYGEGNASITEAVIIGGGPLGAVIFNELLKPIERWWRARLERAKITTSTTEPQ